MIKWIKQKIRWILVTTGIVGVAFAGTVTSIIKADLDYGVSSIESLIASEQDVSKNSNGKYKRYLKYQNGDISVKVDDYFSATRGSGYQIILEREKDGIGYQKSIGHGIREVSGTYDWKEIYNNNPFITSTSTTL